ncbi:TetR/AcrR family transcriptional regulator [Mycobacterium sp. M1]|uniref:TetR/AcrR family transcriptional regulator n=1 Tax=Mycolicibacter acidiphilus TaxID=2835306 RepID=A0ABS5RK45_9MYCO|nr:TetR/AcrR family transcriptional regulator [Mycolicibacter acidiphilus]MBS9534670.1 TetR/AcrR family transcriptional regulator [Mycolicibacter acidiphilus]
MTSSPVVRPFRGVSAEQRLQQRRAALLEAGLTVIADSGMAGTTIEAVCAKAGLSKRYFYEHFRSRDELFAAVADGLIAQILAGAIESVRAHTELEDRFRAASSGVVTFLTADPRRARLFVDVIGNGQMYAAVGRAEHALAELIVDEIVRGTDTSEKQRARQYVVTVILVTGTAQAVTDWLDGSSQLTLDDLIDTVANLSTAAIRTVQPNL